MQIGVRHALTDISWAHISRLSGVEHERRGSSNGHISTRVYGDGEHIRFVALTSRSRVVNGSLAGCLNISLTPSVEGVVDEQSVLEQQVIV